MDGPRSKENWLNPMFRCETTSTVCSKFNTTPTASDTTRSSSEMKRLFSCISDKWRTINSLPSASSFTSKENKEVIVDGYLPNTKRSLIDFLKGMGLKPKIDLVGKETIITADASEINDETLRCRFIKFMKKQVTDCQLSALTGASSTTIVNSRTSKSSSASTPLRHCQSSTELSQDTSKSSIGSEPRMANWMKGRTWTPPNQEDEFDVNQMKNRKEDVVRNVNRLDKCRSNSEHHSHVKKYEKKKEKSVGFKTVGFTPAVEPVENPFKQRIPIDTLLAINRVEEGLYDRNATDEFVEGVLTKIGEPRCDAVNKIIGEVKVLNQNIQESPVDDQPGTSNQELLKTDGECRSQLEHSKKKKRLRILKHLRKCFSKKKKSEHPIPVQIHKECANLAEASYRGSFEMETCNCHTSCYSNAATIAPEQNRFPEISTYHKVNYHGQVNEDDKLDVVTANDDGYFHTSKNCNYGIHPQKFQFNPQTFSGSTSLPVLIIPETPHKNPTNAKRLLEVSKSSTAVTDDHQAQDSYSVVGDKAAIHISKKRIRLEGKDVKYGSILHQDKDFDKHFRSLEDDSASDVEKQVKKVKERIMFARAIGAVGDCLPEGLPKVNYKELLLPSDNKHRGRRTLGRRSYVDVAMASSFYQKFLASMAIMKTTNRLNECDRSVMTDEPLLETSTKKELALSVADSQSSTRFTTRDSSEYLSPTSYLKMLCTCWEPLFKLIPENDTDDHRAGYRRPPENNRTEEEKILKFIVDKVLDCSRPRTTANENELSIGKVK